MVEKATPEIPLTNIELIPEWKKVLKRAWSFRFIVLSGVFSVLEMLLPTFIDFMPRFVFGGLALATIVASGVARVVAQQNMGGLR